MRYLALLLVVVCGGCSDTGQGATCPSPPQEIPPCDTTCGNGRLDQCYATYIPPAQGPDECVSYSVGTEICDGAAVSLTCAQDHYYGGSAACSGKCEFDERGCTACATGARIQSCGPVDAAPIAVVPSSATTGSPRIALDNVIVEIDAQGLTPIATLPDNTRLAGTPTGWVGALAINDTIELSKIDLDGKVTPGEVIAQNAGPVFLAHGPANRTIIMWLTIYAGYQTWYVVVDDNGALVSMPTLLPLGQSDNRASVTSDGTSFFIGAPRGTLYRISGDGTLLGSVSGFPSSSPELLVTANASGGWYLSSVAGTSMFVAQRFDAQGAAVGGAVTITSPATPLFSTFLADGANLVVGVSESGAVGIGPVKLVTFDTTGAVIDTLEVGRGRSYPISAPLGANLVVEFQGAGRGQLAVIRH